MLVTIVIPTYQRAGFVETAVQSVLSQDHPDVELLVLDDGSTDETPAILERIAERVADPSRFRWLRHENVGQAATINRGLELARGELLGYVSSDDYLLPGAISRLVRAAEEHPDAEVVYPWSYVVDDADRVVDTLHFVEHTLRDAVRWGACMVGAGALVRRRYYERVGGWNAAYPTGPDFEWWIRGGDVRFVCVPEPLAAWRTHGGSITVTTNTLERTYDQLRMLDALFARDDLPEHVAAVRNQAYASILIGGGNELLSPDDDDPRFEIYDRVGNRWSRYARQEEDRGRGRLTAQIRKTEHHARILGTIADERFRTIAALQTVVDEQATRIAELEAALGAVPSPVAAPAVTEAAAPAVAPIVTPAPKPLWLRVGRQCTPPPWRHPVGVVVHRMLDVR